MDDRNYRNGDDSDLSVQHDLGPSPLHSETARNA
jgi:hypothetical protein